MFLYYWAKIEWDVKQQAQSQQTPVSDATVTATPTTTTTTASRTSEEHIQEQMRKQRTDLCNINLGIAEKGVRKNIKCYGAWNYRLWILEHGHCNLEHEIELCNKLLSLDTRNFHAWNYRRAIVQLSNRSHVEELKYTKKMIELNFKNTPL